MYAFFSLRTVAHTHVLVSLRPPWLHSQSCRPSHSRISLWWVLQNTAAPKTKPNSMRLASDNWTDSPKHGHDVAWERQSSSSEPKNFWRHWAWDRVFPLCEISILLKWHGSGNHLRAQHHPTSSNVLLAFSIIFEATHPLAQDSSPFFPWSFESCSTDPWYLNAIPKVPLLQDGPRHQL